MRDFARDFLHSRSSIGCPKCDGFVMAFLLSKLRVRIWNRSGTALPKLRSQLRPPAQWASSYEWRTRPSSAMPLPRLCSMDEGPEFWFISVLPVIQDDATSVAPNVSLNRQAAISAAGGDS